jgi:hypothetical protein
MPIILTLAITRPQRTEAADITSEVAALVYGGVRLRKCKPISGWVPSLVQWLGKNVLLPRVSRQGGPSHKQFPILGRQDIPGAGEKVIA